MDIKKNVQAVNSVEKGSKRKSGTAKAAKLEAEIEHYRSRLAKNEERLRTGEASDGTPLTELQRTNLEEIISKQRERLMELSA
jgi:hypothetical protein